MNSRVNRVSATAQRALKHPWAVPAILGLALFLRLLLLWLAPQQPFSDGAYYYDRAVGLVSGHGYREGTVPTAFWPVGHPLILAGSMAVLGPGLTGPLLVNLAATLAILGSLLWLGRRLTGEALPGRMAALLYAIYPASVAYVGTPLAELAGTALVMVGLGLMIVGLAGERTRWPAMLTAGLVLGLAALSRTQFVVFPISALIGVALVWRTGCRRLLAGGVVLHLAMAAVLVPWSLRNQAVLGTPALSTNGGVALFTGANDRATGGYLNAGEVNLWRAAGVPEDQAITRQVEVDRALRMSARGWIADHPVRWLALAPKKVLLLWSKDGDAFWGLQTAHPDAASTIRLAQVANQLSYLALLLAAAPALWRGARAILFGRSRDRPLAILWLVPLFVSLTAVLTTGQTRYHFSAMPFIALGAGWTLMRLARWSASRAPVRLPSRAPVPN